MRGQQQSCRHLGRLWHHRPSAGFQQLEPRLEGHDAPFMAYMHCRMSTRHTAPCPAGDMWPHVLVPTSDAPYQPYRLLANRVSELCAGHCVPAEQLGGSALLGLTTRSSQQCPSTHTRGTTDIKSMSLQGQAIQCLAQGRLTRSALVLPWDPETSWVTCLKIVTAIYD